MTHGAIFRATCNAMDHSPIRQTSELGKFISTAGKSIINLVNCEIWLKNIVKCGKCSHVKFAIFVLILLCYARKSVTTFYDIFQPNFTVLLNL